MSRMMKLADWLKVKDNPIQRDTERHARKAIKHLKEFRKTHSVVHMAELPDGTTYKLDGHTRAHLWKTNQIKHPPAGMVEVVIYEVDNLDEVISLYKTLDAREAVETSSEKVSGAYHQHGFEPQSNLLKSGNITSAIRVCWNVFVGVSLHAHEGTKVTDRKKTGQFDIYRAIDQFANELYALDAFDLPKQNMYSGIMAAFVLTYRKYGPSILPFWRAYFGNAGVKIDGKMDGVQALREFVLSRTGHTNGGTAIHDLAARAVHPAESWLTDREYVRVPPPYDLTDYILNVRPQVKLIRQGTSAHDMASGK